MSHHEIPSDDEVVRTLRSIRGHATALELCKALTDAGYPVGQSQLAIQRAAERGRIKVNADWSLSLKREAAAA